MEEEIRILGAFCHNFQETMDQKQMLLSVWNIEELKSDSVWDA